MKLRIAIVLLHVLLLFSATASAQTSAFNYQGRLNDGSSPANGTFDFQFKIFSLIAGGTQVGSTIDRPGVTVINGVFSTQLDFGSAPFISGNRFLEISVRPAGSSNPYVILGARQQILAVPFAVRSASAAQADNAYAADFATNAQSATTLANIPAADYARLNFQNIGDLRITGNAAIGTTTANARLTLSGGSAWTSNSWIASMNMQNASAIGWEANGSGQRFGIGQTNGGLQFFRTISPFGSTIAPAQTDLGISDNGHLTQPLDRNGAMKAMLAVTANGTIVRCYNGVTGATQNNCDFSVIPIGSPELPFGFEVNFPFDVNGRFWIVTAERSATGVSDAQTAGVRLSSNMVLTVEIHVNNSRAYRPFHLFVF